MVNNRMYLRCPTCEEEILIAKCGLIPDRGWYVKDAAVEKLEGQTFSPLDDFLNEHSHCGERHAEGYSCGFVLRYDWDESGYTRKPSCAPEARSRP